MTIYFPSRPCQTIKLTSSFIACLFIISCSMNPSERTSQQNKSDIVISPIDSPQTSVAFSETTLTTNSKNELEPQMATSKKGAVIQSSGKEKTAPHEILIDSNIPFEAKKESVPKKDSMQSKKNEVASNTPTSFLEKWDNLLQKFVSSSGQVNYKGLKKHEDELNVSLKDFATNMPEEKWSRNEKLAYWINAYNAFTIKLILDNYPLKKMTDLDGGKTWDVKRIELGGKRYSLNQIENDIIRAQFKDARIHFALNCGAKSCPPLFNHAFIPEKLDEQLATRTRTFIRDEHFNQISDAKVELSRIFDWYASDFGDTKTFLKKYLNSKIPDSTLIGFNDYDWTLNE